VHYNFIGLELNEEDYFIVSVMGAPVSGSTSTYAALKTTKHGEEEVNLGVRGGEKKDLINSIEKAILQQVVAKGKEDLLSAAGTSQITFIADSSKFADEFETLEEKHFKKTTSMKLGLLYCKKDQNSPMEILQNGLENPSEIPQDFWDFLKTLSQEIDLEHWKGYRGDMGASESKAYYDNWKGIDIIYHVAPKLDADSHRRLIGNDVCLVIFLEEGASFDPSIVDQFGQVPQIFALVQPVLDIGVRFRVGFFLKSNVKPFDPAPTTTISLDVATCKDFILTKMYNGLMASKHCPPFDRLYYLPLQDRINDLVEKFPLKKSKKSRAKKNAAGEFVLPLPAKAAFQLTDGPNVYDFYCDEIEDSLSWSRTLANVFQTFELNKLLDQGIDDNFHSGPAVPAVSGASGAISPSTPKSPSSLSSGFVIVSGTYGRLGHEKHCKDVTSILKDLVKQQGGAQLVIKAGPKKDVFGNPAEGKRKHLAIIFSCDGKMRRATFKDNDPVRININS